MKESPEKFPLSTVQAAQIKQIILHFTVMDGHPLPVIGAKGFCLLVKHLELWHYMVSWKHLSEAALSVLYGKVCKHTWEEIKYVKAMSFYNNNRYMEVQHFLSEFNSTLAWWEMQQTFGGSHISDAIAAHLKEMFDKWQIPLRKVILRNNANNVRHSKIWECVLWASEAICLFVLWDSCTDAQRSFVQWLFV